ncbi:MAG: hypothetical protein GX050_00965 [Firmicutes bacterium]|nr:hypothetical protein [Bacillota bacterium]
MKDWYMVLISDLKAHLRSNSFLLLNLLALSFLALITTVFWPSGIIVQFERPLLGTAFTHALLAVTVAINLLALNEEERFPDVRSFRAWLHAGNLSYQAVLVGKIFSRSLQGIFLLAATVPLGVIVFFVGGLSRPGLFLLYLLALLATSAAGWLGIYLAEKFAHRFRRIGLSIFFLYLIGLGGTSFFPHPALPLNLHYQVVFFALVALLFLAMLTNLRGWFFR